MKNFMKKVSQFALKTAVPLCSIAALVCTFVANNAPNMCWAFWSYEEDMPESLRSKC